MTSSLTKGTTLGLGFILATLVIGTYAIAGQHQYAYASSSGNGNNNGNGNKGNGNGNHNGDFNMGSANGNGNGNYNLGDKNGNKNGNGNHAENGERQNGALPLQLLPAPREVLVETVRRRDHVLPIRYRDGQWKQLVTAAGPDRISGGRWEESYAREYFRAVTVDGLLVWLYRDARTDQWYLHGWWD